jgi:hypothetical protein
MTLIGEAITALRGCLRLLRGDPHAFADFNVTIDGFWRSFAVIVPQAVLAYPQFLSLHQQLVDYSKEQGLEAAPLDLPRGYLFLVAFLVLWPIATAILTRILGVSAHYVRYVIIYNWMSLLVLTVAIVPSLLHLALGLSFDTITVMTMVILCLGMVVSWIVARRALETTAVIAFAFALADFALTQGLFLLIEG